MRAFTIAFVSTLIIVLASCSNDQLVSMDQLAKGAEVYEKHCMNCHQKDGKGLGKVFPPLLQSDYLKTHQNNFACLVKNGLAGEVNVNGIVYNQQMPGNPIISEQELASLKTYVLQKFLNEGNSFTDADIVSELGKCK